MTTTEIVRSLTDDALRICAAAFVRHASSLRAVRDEQGNLRELTDAEREFGAAVKVEFRKRFAS